MVHAAGEAPTFFADRGSSGDWLSAGGAWGRCPFRLRLPGIAEGLRLHVGFWPEGIHLPGAADGAVHAGYLPPEGSVLPHGSGPFRKAGVDR